VSAADRQVVRARRALLPVARESGLSGLTVDVLDSAEAGAFAWPGGRIFVTRGLLELLAEDDDDDDDDVRAVLAHEVGHLLARPGARGPSAAAGGDGDACLEEESSADAAAVGLLAGCGVDGGRLREVLGRLAARPELAGAVRRQLIRRVERLRGGA
jgi:predicted Zn-dependent protease